MQGKSVPLRDIADMVYTDAPQTIMRTNGRYTVTLTASMKSSEKFTAQDEIEEKLEGFINNYYALTKAAENYFA